MVKSMPIKEIQQKMQDIDTLEDPFIKSLKDDQRAGVQKIYTSWLKKQEKNAQLKSQFYQMREYEEDIWQQGYQYIGGIDEVGRGPLAGPVVASCVILSPDFYLPGLTDSKKLSKQKRDDYFHRIKEEATGVGIGIASSVEIDQMNIYEATKLAMKRAIQDLPITPDYLLLDAMKLAVSTPQQSLIKGDSKSISIAASSVIAKVTRDTYMEELALQYPQYGFERHMGYGTREHLDVLNRHGITKEHRRSFSPVQETMALF